MAVNGLCEGTVPDRASRECGHRSRGQITERAAGKSRSHRKSPALASRVPSAKWRSSKNLATGRWRRESGAANRDSKQEFGYVTADLSIHTGTRFRFRVYLFVRIGRDIGRRGAA